MCPFLCIGRLIAILVVAFCCMFSTLITYLYMQHRQPKVGVPTARKRYYIVGNGRYIRSYEEIQKIRASQASWLPATQSGHQLFPVSGLSLPVKRTNMLLQYLFSSIRDSNLSLPSHVSCLQDMVNEEFHPAKSGCLSHVIELIYMMSSRTSLQ